jgi:VanZ like family
MRTKPRPLTPRSPTRFLPPLLWMGLIALGSSSLLSGGRTGRGMLMLLGHLLPWASPAIFDAAHFGLRKVGHLVEFGVLAILWSRALAPSPRALMAAFVLTTAYGGVDELRQGLDPSRSPAVSDVVVDALGALLGLAAWTEPDRLSMGTLRVAAWVVGLLAGLAVLAIALDWTLGRPVTDVGVAALGFTMVAVGLACAARSGVPARRRPPGPP